ncbi:hypothetical protein HORIV_07020 [Vreelandella olivaria]|uniref:Aminotransferase class I/classII large domain-containing protein n=1 Tax=Vreelandella olivaria TaxID=390919 RepID=A0ABN5WMR9_9GAMM|nr:hypothetical protein HORIV_07020 [Halomonas olivaria]
MTHIPLTIGEPQHAPYPAALEALVAHQLEMARYPATNGLPALRQTIAHWASQRFQLRELDSERHVVPVNGTREAILPLCRQRWIAAARRKWRCPILLSNLRRCNAAGRRRAALFRLYR